MESVARSAPTDPARLPRRPFSCHWTVMLLVCPACSSSYRVAPGSVGAGRTVRCARCRVEWFATEPEPEPIDVVPETVIEDAPPVVVIEGDVIDAFERRGDPETETDAPPADAARPAPAAPRRLFRAKPGPDKRRANARPSAPTRAPRRLPALKVRPIALFAAVAVAALTSAIVARAEIVRSVPDLASLYALVGLPVNVRGLDITNVTSVEEIEDGVPILLVTGAIANVTAQPVSVPRIRLAVTSADERELYAWTTVLGRAQLGPGESASFRARLASPPAEGRSVAVRFLARQDLQPQMR